eukprot:gene2131-2627_t
MELLFRKCTDFQLFKRVIESRSILVSEFSKYQNRGNPSLILICLGNENPQILKYVVENRPDLHKNSLYFGDISVYAIIKELMSNPNPIGVLDYLVNGSSHGGRDLQFTYFNNESSCKKIIKYLINDGRRGIMEWAYSKGYTSGNLANLFLTDAIKNQDFPSLKKYYETESIRSSLKIRRKNYLKIAEEYNSGDDLEIIKYLESNRIGLQKPPLYHSGRKGNISTFRYLLDNYYINGTMILQPLVVDSHPDIIKLFESDDKYSKLGFESLRLEDSPSTPLSFHNNDLTHLKTLVKKNLVILNSFSLDRAIDRGLTDFVKYIYLNFPESALNKQKSTSKAISVGNLEMVKLLLHQEIKCLKTSELKPYFYEAFYNNQIHIMEYFESVVPIKGTIPLYCGNKASLKMMEIGFERKWFSKNAPQNINDIFLYGNLGLLKLLESNGYFQFENYRIATSFRYGRYTFIKYLVNNGYLELNPIKDWGSILSWSRGNYNCMKYLLDQPQVLKSILKQIHQKEIQKVGQPFVASIFKNPNTLYHFLKIANPMIDQLKSELKDLDILFRNVICKEYGIQDNPSLKTFILLTNKYGYPLEYFNFHKIIQKQLFTGDLEMLQYLRDTGTLDTLLQSKQLSYSKLKQWLKFNHLYHQFGKIEYSQNDNYKSSKFNQVISLNNIKSLKF